MITHVIHEDNRPLAVVRSELVEKKNKALAVERLACEVDCLHAFLLADAYYSPHGLHSELLVTSVHITPKRCPFCLLDAGGRKGHLIRPNYAQFLLLGL